MLLDKFLSVAGPSSPPNYIEDVFSTYLYTGTGATQTITNNIDLSTKGGLVWTKRRSLSAGNGLIDTVRGATKSISTNTQGAQSTIADSLTAFTTSGYTLGADASVNSWNTSGTYASWTFRKQPKFFDIVTYTGNGSARTIAHSLGSAPGCILIKRLDTGITDWIVYHRSTGAGSYTLLNTTDAVASATTYFNNTSPTSTVFSLGGSSTTNANTGSYVAYLFAHDAGGFGLTGTDNVISCGTFTSDGSGIATVNLGYEPQYLLFKQSLTVANWNVVDNMRNFSNSGYGLLFPNTSDAEVTATSGTQFVPTATGFTGNGWGTNTTYIYVAIRRGPMKVPTDATKVFAPVSTNFMTNYTTNFPVDLVMNGRKAGSTYNQFFQTRLIGSTKWLSSSSNTAELAPGYTTAQFDSNTGSYLGAYNSSTPVATWNFKRAPNYFDVVCYTGTGSATTFNHNLGVAPEMMIVKIRSNSGYLWTVYHKDLGNTKNLWLNLNDGVQNFGSSYWNSTTPTSTVFSLGTDGSVNTSARTYVNYLFATCPGVSKVGSYTGNGSTQTINCGFTGGARFVLIKRTDSTGDWYVYDTARGMTALTDPYLLMNSIDAETATLGSVTTVTTGFAVNASVLAAINTNAASYIFLAIA